jgi:ubiquinol-cytochrome c reductase cytochrome b subunit
VRLQISAFLVFGATLCIALPGSGPWIPSVSASSAAKDRGAQLFATKGCVHCHGKEGIGGGKGPDLQLVRKRLNAPAITRQIHNGGKEMPAFGETLTSAQIEDLVAYLRAKRKVIVPVQPASPKPAPAVQHTDQ